MMTEEIRIAIRDNTTTVVHIVIEVIAGIVSHQFETQPQAICPLGLVIIHETQYILFSFFKGFPYNWDTSQICGA